MIIFDLETTNLLLPSDAKLEDQPYIIEIGALKLDKKYVERDRLSLLVRPPIPLDEEAHKKITGLTNADLAPAPTFRESLSALTKFFLGEDTLITHNVPFDLGVLVVELRRLNAQFAFPYPPTQICTAEMSQHLWGRRYKLKDMYERLMGTPLDQKHRALDDCRALAEVVRKVMV